MTHRQQVGHSNLGGARLQVGFASFSLGLVLLLAATPALGITLDFEPSQGFSPGTDLARVDLPGGVESSAALVLDEDGVRLLTLHDANGWATSGTQGVFNAFAPQIRFQLDDAFDRFEIDVLTFRLPGPKRLVSGVFLQAFNLEGPLAVDVSDPGRVGDDGLLRDHLRVEAPGISHVILAPVVIRACRRGTCMDSQGPASMWIDDAVFTIVPEPSTAVLVGLGLAAVALRGRTRR